MEGRLPRAEKEVNDLKEQVTLLEARSMRDNLKFYGIDEQQNENTEQTVRHFLRNQMKISDEDLVKIKFDRVHRTAERSKGNQHVIIAKLTSTEGKLLVTRHLDRRSGYGVTEQLPRVLSERKKTITAIIQAGKGAAPEPALGFRQTNSG